MYVQITENGEKPTLSKYLCFGFLFTPVHSVYNYLLNNTPVYMVWVKDKPCSFNLSLHQETIREE